jgi:hypothetical protein
MIPEITSPRNKEHEKRQGISFVEEKGKRKHGGVGGVWSTQHQGATDVSCVNPQLLLTTSLMRGSSNITPHNPCLSVSVVRRRRFSWLVQALQRLLKPGVT